MQYRRPQLVVGLAVLALAAGLMAGCGGAAASRAAPQEAATQAPMPDSAQGGDAFVAATLQSQLSAAQQSYNAAGDAMTEAATEAAIQGTPGPDGSPLVNALPQDRMIVKNGQIQLLVEDAHTAVDQVTQIAVDNGGYVLSSQAAQDTRGAMNATLTIAVRADQFETAMRRLRQIALEVQQETSSGQDVTSEYVDLNSRLSNLEATRDRIAKLLDAAKTVDEALTINQQLSDIEGQIEQVKGRMTYLTGRSAFSTITVNLNQKVDATPTPTPTITPTPSPTPPWSLDPTLKDATNAQVGLVRALLTLFVWIIVVPGPYLLVIGLAVWGFSAWQKRRARPAPPAPPAPGSQD